MIADEQIADVLVRLSSLAITYSPKKKHIYDMLCTLPSLLFFFISCQRSMRNVTLDTPRHLLDTVQTPHRHPKLKHFFAYLREALKKKLRDYLGIFPKRRTPPPFGNFDHFLPYYFGQVGNFWVILRCFKGSFRAMVK